MSDIKEFKKELLLLLEKYNYSIAFDCDNDNDTHGFFDYGIAILDHNDKVLERFDYDWSINSYDIKKSIKGK